MKNTKRCIVCNKIFKRPFRKGTKIYGSITQWRKRIYCSPKCCGQYHLKRYICKECKKEYSRPIRNRLFCSIRCQGKYFSNEKNHRWKGKESSLTAKHAWVSRYKGKAKNYLCIDCGETADDWSNIDHKYSRNLNDYQPRCKSCHSKYDIKNLNKKVRQKGWKPKRPFKKRIGTTSQYKGVCFDKENNKWLAYFKLNNKHINLGRYKKEEEAFVVYNNFVSSLTERSESNDDNHHP